jgi:AcrR family transcriptional regulator
MHRTDSRERIILIAREMIMAGGLASLSVDEISRRLAMSKKTIYGIFRSKEELISSVFERTLAELRVNIIRIMASRSDFPSKLQQFLVYLSQQASRLGIPLQRDLHRLPPEIIDRIVRFRRERILGNLTRLIEEGVQQGHVRPDVDTHVAVLAYLGAVERVLDPSVLANESFSATQAAQGIITIFFKGILTPQAQDLFSAIDGARYS